MDLRVALLTKSHQIIFIMCSTLGEWSHVMDVLRFHVPSVPLAQLTQRVGGDVPSPDPLPLTSVPFLRLRISSEAFVPLIHLFHVLTAERLSRRHKVRTARVAARFVWFPWHSFTPKAKAPEGSEALRSLFTFDTYTIT